MADRTDHIVQDMGPEAGKERAERRKAYAERTRELVALARLQLSLKADALEDVPTQIAGEREVKDAYEDAIRLCRRGEYRELEDKLLELAVAAAGWSARLGFARAREEDEAA